MKKYVLIIVTFFSMGILTAQNDSVRDPGFGKHTIGINVSPLLMGDGINLQYRRTQGKLHFRTRFDHNKWSSHSWNLTGIDDTSYVMNHNYVYYADIKLRIGFEKRLLKCKKVNAFVGADLISGYKEYSYIDRNFVNNISDLNHGSHIYDGVSNFEFNQDITRELILGADVSLGVEFYLTKRLNVTTQLTLPICTTSRNSQGFLRFKASPSLDINLSYKFGGFKK